MKDFKFKLYGLKAVSTNDANAYSKYGVSKSDLYRIFEAEFELLVEELYAKEIAAIKKEFNPERHCIGLEFKFYFSCETKSGRLHKRAGDLTNKIKSTEDALFNMLEIDDAFVTDFRALKIHSEEELIVINLWIKDYETV